MSHDLLTDTLILLAAAAAAVALCGRLRLPPIVAYLLAGVALGPHASGLIGDSDALHLMGEIGVAFLLFVIGLEFSLPQFWAMRGTLLGLGGAQVAAGTLTGGLIAWSLGASWNAALVLGGALAMSSTAIVIKQLTEQLELHAIHGRMSLGILLFQDVAAIPFLVLIPVLAADDPGAVGAAVLIAIGKGAVALTLMLFVGRWLLRPLFHGVAARRSQELFLLTVLLVSLLASWLTGLFGLSLALGAFLAGMMLGETEYRHQIEAEIRPFQDILLGLFFIVVGMQLDLAALPTLAPWIALLVLGLTVGKGLLIALLAAAQRASARSALRAGLVLGHGGEFGLALLALGLSTGLLARDEVQPVLAAIIVSMLIAPLLVRYNGALAARLTPEAKLQDSRAQQIAAETGDLSDHVIVCGYGRVGRAVADRLSERDVPWVALDLDPLVIKDAWEDGRPVFYGDAARKPILREAGLQRARALLVSHGSTRAALKTVRVARAARADLPILVRLASDARSGVFERAGADVIAAETVEVSRSLNRQLGELLDAAEAG